MPKKIDYALMSTLLDYDPETGIVRWKVTRNENNACAGAAVGTRDRHGHLNAVVAGCRYQIHRIAWVLYYKSEPNGDVDHINGTRDDNRIANLRDVSRSTNLQNQRRAHKDNKSGYLGVKPAYGGKWRAMIWAFGCAIDLGVFEDPKVAHEHYLVAKRLLHPGCKI